MTRASELDHPVADIDADAVARVERSEQIAGPAAELEHGSARGDDRLMDGRDQLVVATRRAALPTILCCQLIESGSDRRIRAAGR